LLALAYREPLTILALGVGIIDECEGFVSYSTIIDGSHL
jgi:hypothetical protein